MSTESASRRPFLLEPGESPLLMSSALDVMVRRREFRDASGIPEESIYSDPVSAMPLPIYPPRFPDGRRRWEGVRPEFMWHPLMWLPYNLQAHFADGDYTEPDDVWAVRVLVELADAGLYDAETGTWLDVLSTVGIDVDNEMDVARVEEWLGGAGDPDLDSIDLTTRFDLVDPAWAWRHVSDDIATLRAAEWGLLGWDFLNLAGSLREGLAAGEAVLPIAKRVSTLCWMGAWMLEEALAEPEFEEIVPGSWDTLLKGADALEHAEDPPAGEVDAILAAVENLARAVADRYMPVAERLQADIGSGSLAVAAPADAGAEA